MTRKSLRLSDSINKVDTSLLGTATRSAFGIVSSVSQDDCQVEKPVLLPRGYWGWVNKEQPVQLMRIGNLALIGIPAEPTTMVGRRLREAVGNELATSGVDTLVVAGLANNYSGYLTTKEEYAQQHYEGASTEFGPYQANAYLQEYVTLAQAMRDGVAVTSDVTPPTALNKISPKDQACRMMINLHSSSGDKYYNSPIQLIKRAIRYKWFFEAPILRTILEPKTAF